MPDSVGYDATFLIPDDEDILERCPRCNAEMSYEERREEWTCPECGMQISLPTSEMVELPF